MKMRTIAKTSLALGLLTTGAITVTTQSVKAEKVQSTRVATKYQRLKQSDQQ